MKSYFVKSVFLVTTALLFIMLQACNQSDNKKNQEQTEQHDEVHSHDDHTDDRLALNNGEKWPDDEPTSKNAEIINSIGAQFLEHDNRTLEDYQTFGDDVSKAINTMIQECSMEGEADMALHYWFAPILQDANNLKKATDTKGLSDIALKMVDRMQMYHDYFE